MTSQDSALSDRGFQPAPSEANADEPTVLDFLRPLRHRKAVLLAALAIGAAAGLGVSFLFRPYFTSTTTFLPPQQQQSGAAAALASLGSLASLAGGASGIKSPVDQYVALISSVTVGDRMIARFDLMKVYDKEYRDKTREELAAHTHILSGKKDGLITIAVEDHDAARAEAMANQYVDELRHLNATLAISEAQQRRLFFEKQLQEVKGRLTDAQRALQDSGFNAGALKAEPKAAAEAYARLRAELTEAEVRLSTLRSSLADTAPAVVQQTSTVAALRDRLKQLEEGAAAKPGDPDFVSRYREFKYEEAMFEIVARQYELARADESREGTLIQVVDPAQKAERKSWPKRWMFMGGGALVLLLAAAAWVLSTASRRARDVA